MAGGGITAMAISTMAAAHAGSGELWRAELSWFRNLAVCAALLLVFVASRPAARAGGVMLNGKCEMTNV